MRRFLISVVVLMIACVACFAQEVGSPENKIQITKVESEKSGGYEEVIVYTSDNVTPQIIMLESPNRIALAFPSSTICAPVTMQGKSSLIKMIQAVQFDENTVYVIVEPSETLNYVYASILGRNKFILEFSRASAWSSKTITPSSPEAVAPSPAATIEAAKEVKETTECIVTSEEVFVVSTEVTAMPTPQIAPTKVPAKPAKKKIAATYPLKGRVIVIDPGHGGRDPGFVGASGVLEKNLNLKVAIKLKNILVGKGAKVIMTRASDISTTDKGIVAVANRNKADLFVAIHMNSFTSPKVAGCQAFYFNKNSKQFAKLIEKNCTKEIKRKNRGIKKETYYTVHHTTMPAVLVEGVYLTNPTEEKLIRNPLFQTKLATGIYKGIAEYVKINPKWQRSPK